MGDGVFRTSNRRSSGEGRQHRHRSSSGHRKLSSSAKIKEEYERIERDQERERERGRESRRENSNKVDSGHGHHQQSQKRRSTSDRNRTRHPRSTSRDQTSGEVKLHSKRKYAAPMTLTAPPDSLYVPRGAGIICAPLGGNVQSSRHPRSGDLSPESRGDHASDASESSTPYQLATVHGACSPFGNHRDGPDAHSKHLPKYKWYENRLPIIPNAFTETGTIQSSETYANTMASSEDGEDTTVGEGMLGSAAATDFFRKHSDDDGDYLKTKQSIAWLAIGVTVIQLLVLMLQLAMCGMATFEVNPMLGPYPDAFNEWGGKNAYLMKVYNQWWRLFTPSFLHVGFLHLLANAFCQLEAIALFEREWGSFRWLLVYIVSSVGCNAFASYFDPDTISVGSSGALMGLYGAKLAQVASTVFFDVSKTHYDDGIRLDQLSSVLCGLTIVSLLSSFTYIDWSGHMGGLLTGLLSGMVLFSYTIRRCCSWFLWSTLGFLALAAALAAVLYFFVLDTEPDEDLGDACEYFRSLFPEDYQCGCLS